MQTNSRTLSSSAEGHLLDGKWQAAADISQLLEPDISKVAQQEIVLKCSFLQESVHAAPISAGSTRNAAAESGASPQLRSNPGQIADCLFNRAQLNVSEVEVDIVLKILVREVVEQQGMGSTGPKKDRAGHIVKGHVP